MDIKGTAFLHGFYKGREALAPNKPPFSDTVRGLHPHGLTGTPGFLNEARGLNKNTVR